MRMWNIGKVFLPVIVEESKVQSFEGGKLSENIAIQGNQMCDCQYRMGIIFSVNSHREIHDVYLYVTRNSHLLGKQSIQWFGKHSPGNKLVKWILPTVDSKVCFVVSLRCSAIYMYCNPSTQRSGSGSGVYPKKASWCSSR